MKAKLMILILGLTLLFAGAVHADEVLVEEIDSHIHTFSARLLDCNATQVIAEAKLWYAEDFLAGTEYEDYPVLASAAPYLAGIDDPDNYTSIEPGALTASDMEDLYGFDNDMLFLELSGEQVKEKLEAAAKNLEVIDPEATGDQFLVDEDTDLFYFAVIEGIEYEIDVTKPHGERVINVTYNGDAVADDDTFIVISNGFRASGGSGYPELQDHLVKTGDKVDEVIVDFLNDRGGEVPEPSNNWKLVAEEVPPGPLMFRSSPDAVGVIDENEHFEHVGEYGGWAMFQFSF